MAAAPVVNRRRDKDGRWEIMKAHNGWPGCILRVFAWSKELNVSAGGLIISSAMGGTLHRFVDGLFEELDSPHDKAVDLPTEPILFQPAYAEKAGDKIAHYALREILGEGGFGSVWLADQAKPVRREVALKIIKLGMDTREVIARFEVERQALAVLDHPNIAKVFDAGMTPTGRPYFVMELVRGAPLTTYCNEHQLVLKERLELFTEVCRAVQHAHQKGIIHRDLKPSNLLVTLVDGKPVPKVIDFGIAKATGESRLTDNTLVTQMDRLMGTPAYMSPEQADSGMDIDTRADIYSLGVVLYELLTGQVPFQIGSDGKARRDRDAQRPSTRIKSFTAGQLQQLGLAQRMEGPKLIGMVKGDLDWIAMKALEQGRARRYDSAIAFADDVLAFLHQQPVSARPPTTWYLVTRFTQRNKLAVSAAAAIVLVLIAGIATSTWMYWKEREALMQSQQVSKFMKDILTQAGVSKALGRDTTMMREILDKTAERIGAELQAYPTVQAELHGVIGQTYEDIDEYELAVQQTAEQLRLRREIHTGDHPDLAAALLAHASANESLGKMKDAEALIREALGMRQRLFGKGHQLTVEAHGLFAWVMIKSGRSKDGETSARITYELWQKHPEDPLLADGPRALAAILRNTKRIPQAIEISFERLATLKRLHGPEHPDIVNALDNLGYDLVAAGRHDEAEPLLLESLRQGRKFHQDRSPVADHAYASLSRIAAARKDWEKQLQHARDSLAASKRVFPVGHRYYREGCAVLSSALIQQAERCADEAWKTKDAALAKKALGFIEELRRETDFASEAKSSGAWLECLKGRALMLDAETHDEGRLLIKSGIETLKKKEKPNAEDLRRLKKAEGM
jgi:eukaryotic-like serine/threonine-protein kinase